ncbi:leucyl aminopeptidase [Nocardioides sp. zg-536]|uniref:Probable cytosol aminopeptidase n=1 Tax=Nocardioides faecalis TaxID=2803858 RepID=A0A938Y4Y1_9ACTN|nr:leucyl aminopeptidase [Nocardioides faecalis]MBM9460098.1 leucyl aminopeptidase [Nocardioides faecalis]QVI60108.1 leucyl aminopeptidase [Nocardioides faecalis]
MTTYVLRSASPAKTRAEAVVVGVLADGSLAPGGEAVAEAYGRKLPGLLSSIGISGKAGEVAKVPTGGAIASPLLVLVGLGAEATPDAVRRAAGNVARAVTNAASVALALPADSPELVRAVLEGYRLGGYAFTRYKSAPPTSTAPADVVVLTPGARRAEVAAVLEPAQVLTDAVLAARDWVNTPPADLTPPAFADEIVAAAEAANKLLARAHGRSAAKVEVEVLDEARLAELGCGGLLGVGAGSAAPPRLVELTYAPKDAVAHVALVGKGITFDSGGLWIKPAGSMATMKEDMAGAAAVVQATLAAARLGLPVRISTFAALAENMVGEASMRPGDVQTMYDGTTVEIGNTDAEGRLVLADALGRAVERGPDTIVDVATLTGHMVMALGEKMAGVLGTDEVVAQVLAAGAGAGEDAWPMPLPEFVIERVRSSKVADLAQYDGIRWGGGLFAAAFLREFTGGLPWAHVDIAGPTFLKGGPSGHWTAGATGYGVATLVELLRNAAAPVTDPADAAASAAS